MKYFAPFRLDVPGRTLWRDDVRVPLTHKAFDVLAVLVERAGHLVTKEHLLAAVWPEIHVHPDNVKVLIGEIRRTSATTRFAHASSGASSNGAAFFIAPVVEAPADAAASSSLPIFVGRQPEMNRLFAAFDEAAASHRQVVFVTGDAGIGKTSLCEAFLRVAPTRHAIRATWAQCMRASGPSEPTIRCLIC